MEYSRVIFGILLAIFGMYIAVASTVTPFKLFGYKFNINNMFIRGSVIGVLLIGIGILGLPRGIHRLLAQRQHVESNLLRAPPVGGDSEPYLRREEHRRCTRHQVNGGGGGHIPLTHWSG